MIRAAIFDLDGTLLDTEILWVDATHAYLLAQGKQASYADVLRIVYGRSWRQVYADIVSDFDLGHISMHAMDDELHDMIKVEKARRDDLVLEGSVRLLRELSALMPVCIVSGSPRKAIADAVEMLQIGNCLAFVIGAEEYHMGKPDPTCFQMAIQRLNVPAAACVVFEDSSAGVKAAKAAGAYCVALARPSRPPQDVRAADLVLEDLGTFDLATLAPLSSEGILQCQ
ncbi:MAG: HAD family hydrolase [Kiritimatiellia bacterium]